MDITNKFFDKFFFKQWNIGLAKIKIQDVIRNKTQKIKFKWLPINDKNKFYADPFIIKTGATEYCVFHEEFDYRTQYGKISCHFINDNLEIIESKVLIDNGSHLSYPSVFIDNDKVFIFPEAGRSGKFSGHLFDSHQKKIFYQHDLINLPLIDPTIFKYNNKYWVFSTRIENSNGKLFIHYSDNLFGPYQPHSRNPVKNTKMGSRPAGNIIEVDGVFYRPSQNSTKYYGSSICINKILKLDENSFQEEYYMTIYPDKENRYQHGIHTINYIDDLIVVDGLKKEFSPLSQLNTFLRKQLISESKFKS